MRAALVLVLPGLTAAVLAQAPAPLISESVRLEDWALMRSAASGVLGWRVGISTGVFPRLTFSEAAAKADALGLAVIAGSGAQRLSPEIPKNLDQNLASGELNAVRDRLRALNLRMPVYYAAAIAEDETSARKMFEFAKNLSVEVIAGAPAPDALAMLDRLANEFGISMALTGDFQRAVGALEGRSRRMGVCAGIESLAALPPLKDRPIVIGVRDPANLTDLIREMYRMELKPAFIAVDTSADLSRSFAAFDKALQPVMADRVAQISRTAAIRGADRLTAEEKAQVEAALPQQAPVKPKKPRKLLVMDLNIAYPGHRSIPAENFAIETMGRRTGAYEAVFSNDLDNLKPARIRQFDAILLNNTVGMIFVDPEIRESLERFVREGGGLAGNHGTSHASMDWPEFGEMIGVRWGVHREATEQATIKVDDPASPLTRAFGGKEFVYQDEFFRFPAGPYSRDKLHVLLSMDAAKTDMNQGRPCPKPCSRPDSDYAVSWIRSYGKGRVFFCTLGHNPTLFTTPHLARYFLAGMQFILGDLEADTTPSARLVSQGPQTPHSAAEIDPLLARIAGYQHGGDPASTVEFDELVGRSSGSREMRKTLEDRLLRFLQSDATPAAKEVAFRALSLVGSEASIPVLAPLLVRVDSADSARHALASIPGPAVDEALRKSLAQAPNDRIRVGIINSLGNRKDAKAVPALGTLISNSNVEVVAAAAAALGNIADPAALKTLGAARSKAGPAARDLVAEAYVACADQFAARGEKAAAITAYKQMLAPAEPRMIRIRALNGLTNAAGKGALALLRTEIESKDAAMQAAAIGLLNGLPGADITKVLLTEFPKVAPLAQVHLLTAMAERGDTSARPTVMAALKGSEREVRAAALAALGRLGDESTVKILAEAAAGTGPEQEAARRSLYTLRGTAIDRAIVAAIPSSAGRVKSELIMATGERVAVSAADALTRAARESDPDVRREALRALRNLGGVPQVPALLDLLLGASSGTERREASQTLAAVLRRAQPAPMDAVLSAYRTATVREARLALLDVMGQTSSPAALPLLTGTMKEPDAELARGAILALSAWDDPAPLADLLGLAKSAQRPAGPEPVRAGAPQGPPPGSQAPAVGGGGGGRGRRQAVSNLQVLALRGALKLMVLQSERSAAESARLLGESMGLASLTADKLSILSLLPYFPSQESLEIAQTATTDPAVANEAKVAVAQVQEALKTK